MEQTLKDVIFKKGFITLEEAKEDFESFKESIGFTSESTSETEIGREVKEI
jgi:hypothetical protein